MSYRKIKILDKTYEYTIGKSFTKVKLDGVHFETYSNAFHGSPHRGQPLNTEYETPKQYVVTPLNVKHMILGLPLPEFDTPEGKTVWLMTDPYDSEIYCKTRLIPWSISNYKLLCDEI